MVKPEKKIANVEKKKRFSRPLRPPPPLPRIRGSPRSAANFEELRDDLFREAAKLVAEDPSQSIAIIIAPRASEPNGTMQSFGYPSAEGVVKKFLKDTAPEDAKEEEDDEEEWLERPYWWEDEKLLNSKDPVEIMAAMAEIEKLKKQLEILEHLKEGETGQGSGTTQEEDDGSKP